MKPWPFLMLLAGLLACQAPSPEKASPVAEPTTAATEPATEPAADNGPSYDAALAAEYGADDYGMRQYVMALLRKGPNRSSDSLVAAELQAAHLANINRLAEEGTLLVAGPFLDDGSLRGSYIFDVRTVAEAEALTRTDPAIQAGSLVMELHPWYGSAAMKAIGPLHEKLAKVKR